MFSSTLPDLDVSLIKREFLSKAVAENKRPIEEQLASPGLY